VEPGRPVDVLAIAIFGAVQVRHGGQMLGNPAAGEVIGTATVLLGEPAQIEAQFVEPARYMRWPLATLRTFFDKRPDLRDALLRGVNRDLARKLNALVVTTAPT